MRDAALRPFGFGDLLDGSFALYRRNFFTFFGVALVPQLPIALWWLLFPSLAEPSSAADLSTANLLIAPFNLLIHVWLWTALTYAIWIAYAGGRPGVGESLVQGLRRWPAAAAAFFVALLLATLGFIFFVIPGIIVLAMFFAIFQTTAIEERGAFSALGRSRRLSQGARARIVGVLVVAWLITLLPALAMWAVAGVWFGPNIFSGNAPITQSSWVLLVSNTGGALIGALTVPFFVGVTVLLYVDRRARTEAPDLESAAASLRDER